MQDHFRLRRLRLPLPLSVRRCGRQPSLATTGQCGRLWTTLAKPTLPEFVFQCLGHILPPLRPGDLDQTPNPKPSPSSPDPKPRTPSPRPQTPDKPRTPSPGPPSPGPGPPPPDPQPRTPLHRNPPPDLQNLAFFFSSSDPLFFFLQFPRSFVEFRWSLRVFNHCKCRHNTNLGSLDTL